MPRPSCPFSSCKTKLKRKSFYSYKRNILCSSSFITRVVLHTRGMELISKYPKISCVDHLREKRLPPRSFLFLRRLLRSSSDNAGLQKIFCYSWTIEKTFLYFSDRPWLQQILTDRSKSMESCQSVNRIFKSDDYVIFFQRMRTVMLHK